MLATEWRQSQSSGVSKNKGIWTNERMEGLFMKPQKERGRERERERERKERLREDKQAHLTSW